MPPYPPNQDPIGQIMGAFSGMSPQQKSDIFLEIKNLLLQQLTAEMEEHTHNSKARGEAITIIRGEGLIVPQRY